MIRSSVMYREFQFQRPATTSRGTYVSKKVHFILLWRTEDPSVQGIGECSLFPGLSHDDRPHFEESLHHTVDQINHGHSVSELELSAWPSIRFAFETALLDLEVGGSKILFPSAFTDGREGIRINGLIWMGSKRDMLAQIRNKMDGGFRCLKLKIGALKPDEELDLLRSIRTEFSAPELEIRVDANGAFTAAEATEILNRLSGYHLHSIEQPIASGQPEEMARLCESSPVPVALDEEMIGVANTWQRTHMLDTIHPQYLVLKPGLLGGLSSCTEWIGLAEERNTGWWITSSLETNIGLNAIAQWTYGLNNKGYHGLSTGSLFNNNIPSPLCLKNERLLYDPDIQWDVSSLDRI